MVRKKNRHIAKPLTEVELELMVILWNLGEANIREILLKLQEKRKVAYTSIATIMRILETKGVVKSVREGKTYIYHPLLTKSEYESRSLNAMVKKLFDDTPLTPIARLIEQQDLSQEDLEEIKAIINKKEEGS